MKSNKIETFEDLRVWQKGISLVKQVYLITREGEISRDFGYQDQLRRAAVSIPTNIAEGFERYSRKEYVNFLNIAKGSAGEVRSLVRVALTSVRRVVFRVKNYRLKVKGKRLKGEKIAFYLFPFPFNQPQLDSL